jgi:hypothetical protein
MLMVPLTVARPVPVCWIKPKPAVLVVAPILKGLAIVTPPLIKTREGSALPSPPLATARVLMMVIAPEPAAELLFNCRIPITLVPPL